MKVLQETKLESLQKKYGLIGTSDEIKDVVRTIEQVGPTDISVLIEGESGTGKELVVRALHAESTRSSKPLVVVNGGAIPEGLIESELFGHVKGSFTGALSDRKGFFEEAHTELNPQITYGVVEAIEMNNISYAQVKDFANNGYLKIP